MARGGRRAGIATALLAIPYLPFLAGLDPGEGLLGAVFVGGASLGAPGVVGLAGPGGHGPARRFVRGLLFVSALNILAAVALVLLELSPTPRTFAAALGALTVGAGALVFGRGGTLPDPRRETLAIAVAAVTFLLALFAGTSVVPLLEDQDTEVQWTAYGLAHDLQPICLTNRSTLYFFAHPLLLHALNASTLVLAGDLETIRPAYDAAVAERERSTVAERERGIGAVLRALRDPTPPPDRDRIWRRDVYARFVERPALFGTRAPNFVLAAAAAVLVSLWSRRLGASSTDAALVTLAYVTLPEIFVRSAYGGYYPVTVATFLSGAWLASGAAGGGRSGFAAGALTYLANQKAFLIAAAVAAVRGSRLLFHRTFRELGPALPILLGTLAGTVAFWIYGLGLAPADFVADHLVEHGLERFSGREVLTRSGQSFYPSRPALWLEFARHTGWVWTGLAGLALTVGVRKAWQGIRRTNGVPAPLSAVGHLTLWVIVGAILFTAIDWRQTKHLCLLVPALSVLIGGVLLPAVGSRTRLALRAALGVSILWNVSWIIRLARDFDAMTMSTMW